MQFHWHPSYPPVARPHCTSGTIMNAGPSIRWHGQQYAMQWRDHLSVPTSTQWMLYISWRYIVIFRSHIAFPSVNIKIITFIILLPHHRNQLILLLPRPSRYIKLPYFHPDSSNQRIGTTIAHLSLQFPSFPLLSLLLLLFQRPPWCSLRSPLRPRPKRRGVWGISSLGSTKASCNCKHGKRNQNTGLARGSRTQILPRPEVLQFSKPEARSCSQGCDQDHSGISVVFKSFDQEC